MDPLTLKRTLFPVEVLMPITKTGDPKGSASDLPPVTRSLFSETVDVCVDAAGVTAAGYAASGAASRLDFRLAGTEGACVDGEAADETPCVLVPDKMRAPHARACKPSPTPTESTIREHVARP